MLRRSTSSVLQRRKTMNPHHTNHTILRSRRNIPQYSDTLISDINNMNGYQEENRFGDFNVLNENNHPGVIYYFIEVTNPLGNNNNNNNNSSGGNGYGNVDNNSNNNNSNNNQNGNNT